MMERKTVEGMDINAVITTVFFLLVLIVTAVFSAAFPKRNVSELENRNLASMPMISAQTMLDGSWVSGVQEYTQDHIAGRDRWIDFCSGIETSVFRKTEKNGVLLGKDGWMFSKYFAVEGSSQDQFDKNVDAVTKFCARYRGRVTFILVPSASLIYVDKLPDWAPQIEENAMLTLAFSDAAANDSRVLDLREVFYREKNNIRLYYKTDHHWTTDGAYLAYLEYCALMDIPAAFSTETHTRQELPGFLGTHYSAARWNHARSEILSYYVTDSTMTVFEVNGEDYLLPLYDMELVNQEKLAHVDKYGAFLDGNHGYVEISGNGTGRVLVVKDSYANSFVPFLTENYETVGVVDFRNFPYGLDSMIESREYDGIIILYSFNNFLEDNHVVFLNRPSVTISRTFPKPYNAYVCLPYNAYVV